MYVSRLFIDVGFILFEMMLQIIFQSQCNFLGWLTLLINWQFNRIDNFLQKQILVIGILQRILDRVDRRQLILNSLTFFRIQVALFTDYEIIWQINLPVSPPILFVIRLSIYLIFVKALFLITFTRRVSYFFYHTFLNVGL